MKNILTMLAGCLTLSLLGACDRSNEGKKSLVKHEFSRISRSDNVLPVIFERSKCEQIDYASLGGDENLRNLQKTAQAYLGELSFGIMERVNQSVKAEGREEVFSGVLAPQNFCYSISDSLEPYMNASMLPQTLELTVNPSVFYRLSSESSIASVVCHELAHASMRHADQPIKPELRKQLLDSNQKEEQFSLAVKAALAIELVILDEAIVAKIFGDYSDIANQMFLIKYEMQDFIRTRLDAILYGLASPGQQDTQALYISYRYKQYLDLFSKLDDGESVASDYINLLSPDERQVFADFMANLQRIKQEKIGVDPVSGLDITAFDAMQILQGLAVTIDKAYGGIELSFVNWMESEADQVGLEICARAGLDISKFEEFHRLSSNFQSSLLLAQQDSIEACMSLIERGEIPLRSSDTHPTPCSRLFDVRYREPEFHKSQYDQLKARQTQNNPILGETRLEALKRMFE